MVKNHAETEMLCTKAYGISRYQLLLSLFVQAARSFTDPPFPGEWCKRWKSAVRKVGYDGATGRETWPGGQRE